MLFFDLRLCFLWDESGFISSPRVAIVIARLRSGLVQSLRISVALLNIGQPAGAAAVAVDSRKDAEAEEV